MVQKKVLDAPFKEDPVERLPEMDREIDTGAMRFILLPPGITEWHGRPEKSVIDVNLNPIEHLFSANSDRVQSFTIPADSIAFLAHGNDFRLKTTNFLPGLLVEVDLSYWSEAMLEVFGPGNEGKRGADFLNYEHDPVGAELGRAAIRLLMDEHRTGGRVDGLAFEGIGLGLIARIAKRLEDDSSLVLPKPTRSALARRRLGTVLEFAEDNLATKISVADMASVAAMSPSYFARSFKLAMGVGPARYVTIRRIERAKMLLMRHEISIAEVAYLSGFTSQAYLTRTFRDLTGTTPAAFRMQLLS